MYTYCSSAQHSRVLCSARLASELAPERYNVLVGARQLSLQHVHSHVCICLQVSTASVLRNKVI